MPVNVLLDKEKRSGEQLGKLPEFPIVLSKKSFFEGMLSMKKKPECTPVNLKFSKPGDSPFFL